MASLKLIVFLLAVATIAHADNVIGVVPWAQGTICYRYDSSVSARLQTKLQQAMETWETAACVRFEMSDDNDCILFYSYPNEEYCRVGPNEVILGYSCQSVGDLLYAMGEVIGLSTEQSRPDRDEYVSILTENINEGQEHNFAINDDRTIGYQGVGYDYSSIMHLSASAYSENGNITTKVNNEEEYTAQGSPELGERLQLSEGDILKANRLYNCRGTGKCEMLSISIGRVLGLTDYQVEVVTINSEGTSQTLSTSDPQSNTELNFPVNAEKMQFFRIAVKENTPENKLLSTVETVPIEVGRSSSLYHNSIGTSQLSMNFSYECTADGDDCTPYPCVVATACTDELFNYTCDCYVGFGGKNCDIQCPRGYDGRYCENDISGDSCSPNPCVQANSESCDDGLYDYTCNCKPRYTGKRCEIECPRGYDGRYCNNDISGDSCSPNPCVQANSESCDDGLYDYTCNCKAGYYGKRCENDISGDSCLPNPCVQANSESCDDGFYDYTCNCKTGYGGKKCENDISVDSCSPNPCVQANSESCVDGFYDYTCNCKPRYTGKRCEIECPRGYDGRYCNTDISEDSCSPNPCVRENSESCDDGLYDYTCNCKTGYCGKRCENDISGDSCSPNPCVEANSESCVDGFYNYTCNCKPRYTGKKCETDINLSCSQRKGDGYCDYDCNTRDLQFDGGDCCLSTCLSRPRRWTCGINGYDCAPFEPTPLWFTQNTELCFQWRPDGDGGQCGGGADRELCAQVGSQTAYYRDDTDRRSGGCRMQWKVRSPYASSWFINGVSICYRWYADGDGGQCGGGASQNMCAPVGSYTPEYRDDTDGRSGGCRMSWKLSIPSGSNSPQWLKNAQLCYLWYPDGNGGQCGAGEGRELCARANSWTTYYRDDTDRRSGGCRMSWKLKY